MSKLMEIKNMTKNYYDATDSRNIISNMNFSIDEGDFLCILGPSGCGKTTLIRCIAGFEDYEGEITVAGEKVTKPGIDRMMIFQDYNQLFPWKTVKKNIQYPMKVNGVKDKDELEKRAMEQLEIVNLPEYAEFYPHQLSGGMKQRVAIARGLVMKPKIILMDEPFAALDAMTRNKLQIELLRIKERENATIIFITHNIQEAIVLGNRVMLMNKNGELEIDMKNEIPKPVTPASEGYGKMWKTFSDALENQQ